MTHISDPTDPNYDRPIPGEKLKYALEIRLTLDTDDRERAESRADAIIKAIRGSHRMAYGEIVSEEIYTYYTY